ncbi:MAG TPA: FliM/FliN family flagellar motor switch protein [Methylomirabilota bacterium]|jgi:flagellar motor switch protein FliM|nr:FliM/FliN family flagellar motor switch protein [Methylomirabilota bacterium]
MKKILSQDEIDALFAAAKHSQRSVSGRKMQACDLRKLGALNADQVRVVTTLHETFARRLGGSLGAYLRVGFDMNLVSVEQILYSEFLSRLPELTYLASLQVLPLDARATMQADLSLVFPIVDLVLGGSGADPIELREMTEIEEQIFETVVRVIARDLQTTWTPVLPLDIQFDQRQQHTQVHGLMLPTEKVMSLTFEIRLPDARGTLNLAFPAVISNALLRKLSVQWSYAERSPSQELRRQLQDRLLESRFAVDLSLPPSPLSIREIVELEPGRVLVLPKRAQDPINLNVAGKPMFHAYPIRQGSNRGARVERRVSLRGSAKVEGA